jgi:Leucine-rich repeat (LRR) protein
MQNLWSLKELVASNSELESFPSGISMLTNLARMDLSMNKISEIPEDIKSLGKFSFLKWDSQK